MKAGSTMTEEQRHKISVARKGKFRGESNSKWRGGRIMLGGYWYIYSPEHPHKTQAGYVAEHRLVMEKKIGRYLTPIEIVHHVDENTLNNAEENLELCDNQAQHTSKHLDKIKKAGDNSKAKFSNQEAIEIRRMLEKGFSVKALAKEHSVNTETIRRIKHRLTYDI